MGRIYNLHHYLAIKESVLSGLKRPLIYYLLLEVLTDEWKTGTEIAYKLADKIRYAYVSPIRVMSRLNILYKKGIIERKRVNGRHLYRRSSLAESIFREA